MSEDKNASCTYEGTDYAHGETTCNKDTNTIHRCDNGEWVDTGTPCIHGSDEEGGKQ